MSNVNPNHYKVAGRERQGDGLLQERHRQKFAGSRVRDRFEARQPPFVPATAGLEGEAAEIATGPVDESARPTTPEGPKRATTSRRPTATWW